MPSDEQQFAEPLLDHGGNDRFVLFPLKYDAVWEMVRLSYDIISSIFKNLSVFEAFEICACADVLSSLSLSLSLSRRRCRGPHSHQPASQVHSHVRLHGAEPGSYGPTGTQARGAGGQTQRADIRDIVT